MKLILGTVQLGLNYGINNRSGKPDLKKAFDILATAYENGIRVLDTAEAYGNSQEVIGAFLSKNPHIKFSVITKLGADKKVMPGNLESCILQNCKTLNVDSLEGYMFHNYDSFKKSEYLYTDIVKVKNKGLIQSAGISLYTNQEIVDIIDNYPEFDFIQIPFNLLDNHAKRSMVMKKAKAKGMKIHTRSVFLQGLFFMPLNDLPTKLLGLKPYLKEVENIKNKVSLTLPHMALQYVLQKEYIDNVLIGVESAKQLEENIKMSKRIEIMFSEEIDKINVREEELLNPSNWN